MKIKKIEKLFILKFLIFLSFFYTAFLLINVLVDPLWYFKGNRIGETNYVFNERLSKFNHFYYGKNDVNYDCLLFGSSVSTTINQEKFKNNTCFNFSFSAGKIKDYLVYLEYLKFLNLIPEIIYLELPIDITNKDLQYYSLLRKSFPNLEIVSYIPPVSTKQLFSNTNLVRNDLNKNEDKNLIPVFIKDVKKPDKFWKHYVSFNSFSFSIKSLMHLSNYTNAYDKNFISFVRRNKVGKPKLNIEKQLISENYINYLAHERIQASKYFNKTFDFSVPNKAINNEVNTYDGSHYYENFISKLPIIMETSKLEFGLIVNDNNYKKQFISSANLYLKNKKK